MKFWPPSLGITNEIKQHPIRAFAVLCVAGIAIYLGWMGYRINETLSSPIWCRAALGAEKLSGAASGDQISGLQACVGLLTIQLKSVSTNSHITFGAMALCLVTLIVIVIAGAKLSGNFAGNNLNISPANAAAAGAAVTAEAAGDKAQEIAAAATGAPSSFTAPPGGEQL